MALPVSTLVRITTSIAAGGVPRLPFGRGLLITEDSGISPGGTGKAQLFSNISDANAVLDAGDALDGATVWFSANPIPQGLWVGRWTPTDQSTTLTSDTPTVAAGAAPLNATNATFSVSGQTVTVNLSSAATYTAIATAIQAGIVGLAGTFTGATFLYNAPLSAFVLTLASSDAITPPYFEAVATGTNIATALGMAQASNPTYALGHNAESVTDALGEIIALTSGGPPVAIMLAADASLTAGVPVVDTREAVAAYASAGDFMFGLLDTSAQALVPNDATSQSALAFSRNQGQVMAFFDNVGEQPDIGGMALLSAQNLSNVASIITPHAKAVPGVAASTINGCPIR